MNANYPYPYTPPPAPPKRRNRLIIILVVGLVLFLCCCVVAAAVIVIADPFNLHIKDRLFGGTFDAAAEAMPEDTGVYIGVNLLGATPDQLDRVIRPFADALEMDQKNWDELIQEVDRYLGEQMDVTLTDDVMPWIGQYLGISVFDIQLDNSGNPASLIIAIESRNNNAADEFLRKLRDSIENSSQEIVHESEYQGVTIYVHQPETGTGVAFCRSGSLVLFSLEENDLHTAIDAQKGRSMVDNNRYRDMIKKVPGKRIATFYLTSQVGENLIKELQGRVGGVYDQLNEGLVGTTGLLQTELTQINLDTWDAMIYSISITDAGLQLDNLTSYNLDKMSAAQRESLKSAGISSKTVDMFPEDTLGFITSQRLDLTYDTAIQTIRDVSQDASDSVDNALQSVSEATNIDLEQDLFHRLDGEFAIGIFPSSQGFLAQQGNVNLGFAFLAESSDTGALANTMDMFASKIEEEGAGFDRFESGDLTLYEFLLQPGGDILFAGGIGQKYMAIASSSQTIDDLFAGKTPLSKSSRYRDAIDPLPNGVKPVLYLDVEGIIGIIRESLSGNSLESFDQGIKVLDPIPYVVAGYSELKGSLMRITLIIHVR